MKLQSSHNEFQGPVQLSHRSQKISPSKWPAAGILGPDLVTPLTGVNVSGRKYVKNITLFCCIACQDGDHEYCTTWDKRQRAF